jgi:hypothetical protein
MSAIYPFSQKLDQYIEREHNHSNITISHRIDNVNSNKINKKKQNDGTLTISHVNVSDYFNESNRELSSSQYIENKINLRKFRQRFVQLLLLFITNL